MNISFSEAAVLACACTPKTRDHIAADAAALYQSPTFDSMVARANVSSLIIRGYLRVRLWDLRVEITREGFEALRQSSEAVEALRSALSQAAGLGALMRW